MNNQHPIPEVRLSSIDSWVRSLPRVRLCLSWDAIEEELEFEMYILERNAVRRSLRANKRPYKTIPIYGLEIAELPNE